MWLPIGFFSGIIIQIIAKQYSACFNQGKKKKLSIFLQLRIFSMTIVCSYIVIVFSYQYTLLCICFILLLLDSIDCLTMYVPDSVLFLLFLLIVFGYSNNMEWFDRILGMVIISVPMILVNICYKESFGGGDIKLISIMGYALGYYQILMVMVLSSSMGSLWSIYLLGNKKIETSSYIPFIPHLCTSIIIILLFGKELSAWYF